MPWSHIFQLATGRRGVRKPRAFLETLALDVPAEGVIDWARYLLGRAREQDEDPTPPALRTLPIDQGRKWKEWSKLKYRLRKANPEGWKQEWRKQILPELKAEEKGRPLFRRPGRPKRAGPWSAVWLLRAYFAFKQEAARIRREREKKGRGRPDPARARKAEAAPAQGPPSWTLLAELLTAAEGGRKWTAATLRAGWHRQKHRFENKNEEAFLWGECCHVIGLMVWWDKQGTPWGSQAFRDVLVDLLDEFLVRDKDYERLLAKGSPLPSPSGDPCRGTTL